MSESAVIGRDRRGRRRAAIGGLCAALTALMLAACGSSSSSNSTAAGSAPTGAGTSASAQNAATGSPINVALISFKVPGEDSLTPMQAGAEAAARVINAKGGFGGHPVHIVSCNSMLEPAASTDCAHKTIVEHPIAMIGCELAWATSGLPVYAAEKTPSINCLDTQQDFTNQWSFGVNPGAEGDNAGLVAYLCSDPSVHRVAATAVDLPAEHAVFDSVVVPKLRACGKTVQTLYVPTTSVDISPYMTKIAQARPDFVIGNIESAEVPQMYSLLEQNNIPASHIAAADVDFTHQILASAPQMKGGIDMAEFNPWTDTSDPQVAAYNKATQGSSSDPRDPTVEWGYSDMMWLYDASKAVGFSKLTGTTLANYLRTATNKPVPLSHTWINPGPSQTPQIKQPYVRIMQWTGTTFKALPAGPKKDGWVTGLQ
jgi:ABC-type branched-subunit amino acid transport system substrate-binding protein